MSSRAAFVLANVYIMPNTDIEVVALAVDNGIHRHYVLPEMPSFHRRCVKMRLDLQQVVHKSAPTVIRCRPIQRWFSATPTSVC